MSERVEMLNGRGSSRAKIDECLNNLEESFLPAPQEEIRDADHVHRPLFNEIPGHVLQVYCDFIAVKCSLVMGRSVCIRKGGRRGSFSASL